MGQENQAATESKVRNSNLPEARLSEGGGWETTWTTCEAALITSVTGITSTEGDVRTDASKSICWTVSLQTGLRLSLAGGVHGVQGQWLDRHSCTRRADSTPCLHQSVWRRSHLKTLLCYPGGKAAEDGQTTSPPTCTELQNRN